MEVNASGFVITNPLAGTRHREADPAKDALLHNELFTDAKEVRRTRPFSMASTRRSISSMSARDSPGI